MTLGGEESFQIISRRSNGSSEKSVKVGSPISAAGQTGMELEVSVLSGALFSCKGCGSCSNIG